MIMQRVKAKDSFPGDREEEEEVSAGDEATEEPGTDQEKIPVCCSC